MNRYSKYLIIVIVSAILIIPILLIPQNNGEYLLIQNGSSFDIDNNEFKFNLITDRVWGASYGPLRVLFEFSIDKSGDFAGKRKISLGAQNPRFYEVLAGLEPGEEVVVSSYDNFGDVDKLMLK